MCLMLEKLACSTLFHRWQRLHIVVKEGNNGNNNNGNAALQRLQGIKMLRRCYDNVKGMLKAMLKVMLK